MELTVPKRLKTRGFSLPHLFQTDTESQRLHPPVTFMQQVPINFQIAQVSWKNQALIALTRADRRESFREAVLGCSTRFWDARIISGWAALSAS